MFLRTRHILAILILAFSLAGCRVTYIMHAAVGQFKMLASVKSVEELEAQGGLDPRHMDRVRFIQEVRRYAEQELGIKKTENYTTVYLKPLEEPLYTVSAAPKDALRLKTWWFPVLGHMPYLGFFSRERAEKEKNKLEQQGYDVVLRGAEAYSTLGWFKDPITMNMLERPPAVLADTIIHELTHVTLYVKGQGAFNEGLALFMGRMGAVSFLERYLGAEHPQTRLARLLVHDQDLFSRFLKTLLEELSRLYASSLSFQQKIEAREKVYAAALRRFAKIKPLFRTTRFLDFDRGGVNNARLASLALYHEHFSLFREVYLVKGRNLKATLSFFVKLARGKQGDLLKETRRWLQTHRPLRAASFPVLAAWEMELRRRGEFWR